jgi:hypothetical protein
VERKALWARKANEELTVLTADNGNVTMVLTTASYPCKIAALLENQAYRTLKKDSPESVECMTILLLKKASCSTKHLMGFHIT